MSVEFIPAAHVAEVTRRIQSARQSATASCGPAPREPSAVYWEGLFETNATRVLAEIGSVHLNPGFVVRYRFFGEHGGDLLVRPFVARATTDVDTVRQLIDWHPAPDSVAGSRMMATQDVELLYRHFDFPRTAVGFFDYWITMQELWASSRWVHSHLITSADELRRITAGDGWEVVHPVQAYEPAIVLTSDSAQLAVLLQSPLRRFAIHLEQIEIGADHAVGYGESVLVASGPRGYLI